MKCKEKDITFKPLPKFKAGKVSVDADLYVIINLIYSKNQRLIAQAENCDWDSKKKLATVGRLTLNLAKMALNEADLFGFFSETITVVHEIFHIIGFNSLLSKNFVDKKIEPLLNDLKNLRNAPIDALIDNAHFSPALLPSDLMIPDERIDATLTTFSLEFIDNTSETMVTSKKFMQNNFLLDGIFSHAEFFSYKCPNTGDSQYPSYCTKEQKTKRPYGCDQSYLYKASCLLGPAKEFKNNCFLKMPDQANICIKERTAKKDTVTTEHFGFDSRCFENATPSKLSYCLQFRIEGQKVVVKVKNKEYVCSESGQVHKINPESFKCPKLDHFIETYEKTKCPNLCFGSGTCTNGKCYCYDGYDPATNCETRLKETGRGTVFVKELKA